MTRQTFEARTAESNTFTRQQIVQMVRDEVALILRGTVGQTAHMLELRDSTDARFAFWDAYGHIGIGAVATTGTPDGSQRRILDVEEGYSTIPDSGDTIGAQVLVTLEDYNGVITGMAADQAFYGLKGGISVPSGTDITPTYMYAGFFNATFEGDHPVDTLIGWKARASLSGIGGALTEVIGGEFNAEIIAGAVPTIIGMRIRPSSNPNSSSVDTWVQLDIGSADPAHATATYSIRTATGLVSFGDDQEFRDSAKGPILIDRTTVTRYRLYIDNGVLSMEAV